jgi:hypothetical protein
MTDIITDRRKRMDAVCWQPVIVTFLLGLVVVVGIGFAGFGGSDTKRAFLRSVDQMLWTQALRGSPAVTDLKAVVPVWREREGASGDRIIERVDQRDGAHRREAAPLAVINMTAGEALPLARLVEQAAKPQDSRDEVVPANFEGLAAGDRVTVTTTDGNVFTFEVVPRSSEYDDVSGGRQAFVIRFVAPDGADTKSTVQQLKPRDGAQPVILEPQQDL